MLYNFRTAVPSWFCSKAVYRPVWHIPLLSVRWINSWWWTEELSETCRVSCQNKFVKLVNLDCFIIKNECMYSWMNEWIWTIWSGVNRSLRGEKPVMLLLLSLHTSHRLAWDWAWIIGERRHAPSPSICTNISSDLSQPVSLYIQLRVFWLF